MQDHIWPGLSSSIFRLRPLTAWTGQHATRPQPHPNLACLGLAAGCSFSSSCTPSQLARARNCTDGGVHGPLTHGSPASSRAWEDDAKLWSVIEEATHGMVDSMPPGEKLWWLGESTITLHQATSDVIIKTRSKTVNDVLYHLVIHTWYDSFFIKTGNGANE